MGYWDRETNEERKARCISNTVFYATSLLMTIDDFRSLAREKVTFAELEDAIGFKRFKKTYIVIKDRESSSMKYFSFMISDAFCLWDGSGCTSLRGYKYESKDEVISDKFCDCIKELIDDYINGVIHCSCCDKKLTKDEIAGYYFAGSYCTDCWEGKYKALEAAETYN